MKSGRILTFLTALLFTTVMAMALSHALGFEALFIGLPGTELAVNIVPLVMVGLFVLAMIRFGTPSANPSLFVGLAKEIWLPVIKENFWLEADWLMKAQDWTVFVENDKINLAEAGAAPEVLVNNTTYPVDIVERADTPISMELDYWDTENTVVRNAEVAELSYDKMKSVTFGHRMALLDNFRRRAAHAYAPSADDTFTPVLAATGEGRADGSAFKAMTFADAYLLLERMLSLDAPEGGWHFVLNPKHSTDLLLADQTAFKALMEELKSSGINTYRYSKTPIYNKSTGAKVAFGAAAAPTTDTHASFFFHETEVMRCEGTLDMFSRLKDPEQRGDIIGFQQRGLALPIRNKLIGAIYSPATA